MVKRLLLLLLFAVPADAANVYVSKTGTDGAGCGTGVGTDACLTIGYALANSMSGGDVLNVQAGQYTEYLILTSALNGTAENYTTIKSYQNDNVTINYENIAHMVVEFYDASALVEYFKMDGSGTDSGRHLRITTNNTAYRCIQIRHADHIWLTNLEVDGAYFYEDIKFASQNADSTGGGTDDDTGPKDCIIENSDIYNGGDYGIKIAGWGTDNNIIRNNLIHNNGKAGQGASRYGINLSGSGYVANKPTGNQIYGNRIYSNYAYGINILNATDTLFHDNFVYSNGTGGSGGRGVQVSAGTTGTLIYNNVIHDNTYYGLEFYGSGAAKAYNNVIYQNVGGLSEIMIQNSAIGAELYNNSVSTSGINNSKVIYVKSGTGHILENNIVVSYLGTASYAIRADVLTATISGNDLWTTGTGVGPFYASSSRTVAYLNDTWKGTAQDNINEDPIWSASYSLTDSSPSGAGHVVGGAYVLSTVFTTDIAGTVRGAAWDMGAYEYVAPTISDISSGTPTKIAATITWTTDVSSGSLVNYGLSSSYGLQVLGATATSHSVGLSGLSSGTTYHFQVCSGPTCSTDQTLATAAPDPTPVLTSIVASATTTTATITWTTDRASDSHVSYGLTVEYGSSKTVSESVTDHSMTLTGLTPGTQYHFTCTSSYEGFTGATGTYQFNTDPIVPASTGGTGSAVHLRATP